MVGKVAKVEGKNVTLFVRGADAAQYTITLPVAFSRIIDEAVNNIGGTVDFSVMSGEIVRMNNVGRTV